MSKINVMTVRLDAITIDETLILRQAQRIDPEHVIELAQAMRRGDRMPPIILWKADGKLILLDGHHRVAAVGEMIERAARSARDGKPLPRAVIRAEIREGSKTDALVWMIDGNKRAKLNVSREDRSQHAWRLTLETSLSAEETGRVAGVTGRTVRHMRSTKRDFESRGLPPPATWREARGVWEPPTLSETDRAAKVEVLTKQLGDLWQPLSRHEDSVFWEALEKAVSPRRLREGLGWLIDELGDYADDEGADPFQPERAGDAVQPRHINATGNPDF